MIVLLLFIMYAPSLVYALAILWVVQACLVY